MDGLHRTGRQYTYLFPSLDSANQFDNLGVGEQDDDSAIAMGAHKLIHEDRLCNWIREFDNGEDMYTCHIFCTRMTALNWLHMNRTGRNKQTEDVND